MDDEFFSSPYNMNAFGSALNLVFMRRSDALVPIPLPVPVNLRMHSMSSSSYFPAKESQNAFHEFLSPSTLNLRMHSMSSCSMPMDSISECIP